MSTRTPRNRITDLSSAEEAVKTVLAHEGPVGIYHLSLWMNLDWNDLWRLLDGLASKDEITRLKKGGYRLKATLIPLYKAKTVPTLLKRPKRERPVPSNLKARVLRAVSEHGPISAIAIAKALHSDLQHTETALAQLLKEESITDGVGEDHTPMYQVHGTKY